MNHSIALKANFKLAVTILTAFILMIVLSTIAFWREGRANPPADANSFEAGFYQGFLSGHVSRSLINAVLFSGIAGFRRTQWTIVGALILVALAGVHLRHYIASFPSIGIALTTLAPALGLALIGPASWLEYFLVFRVYRAWREVGSLPTADAAAD